VLLAGARPLTDDQRDHLADIKTALQPIVSVCVHVLCVHHSTRTTQQDYMLKRGGEVSRATVSLTMLNEHERTIRHHLAWLSDAAMLAHFDRLPTTQSAATTPAVDVSSAAPVRDAPAV
jgi:hypothetical protein